MNLVLQLAHTKIKGRVQEYTIFGVDASAVARIIQEAGRQTQEPLVSAIARQKLPDHFSNFRIVSWEWGDRPDVQVAQLATKKPNDYKRGHTRHA